MASVFCVSFVFNEPLREDTMFIFTKFDLIHNKFYSLCFTYYYAWQGKIYIVFRLNILF